MKEEIKIECPKHLLSTKTSNILFIHKKEYKYYAFLNNLDEGRNILITEKIFNEIKNNWENERSINLMLGGGAIRDKDSVIIPNNCIIEMNYDE